MDFNQFKGGEEPGKGKDAGPVAPSFFSNIFTVLLLFLVIILAYSYLAEKKAKTETVSLSSRR